VESWRKHGVVGWEWLNILETFKAIENADSGDDAYHGRTGPLSIRQRSYDELTQACGGSSTLQSLFHDHRRLVAVHVGELKRSMIDEREERVLRTEQSIQTVSSHSVLPY
jgi:hypothetical protein